jgi:proteasome-associated ATPase
MAENLEQQINQEVQRRLGSQMRRSHEEVSELRDIIRDQNTKLVQQHSTLKRLLGEPLTFGTLLRVHNHVDPRCFKTHDTIIVCDEASDFFQQGGTIISGINDTPVIDAEGCCLVKLHNESEIRFGVGLENKEPAQIRLADKDDGTFAVVSIDGKPWEVKGIPDLNLIAGDPVKIKPDTKAIVSRGYNINAGPVCHVVSVTNQGVEVQAKSDRVIVFNPHNFSLAEGDRVACDHGMFCIIEKLERDPRERYKLKNDLSVTWDDVGGLEIAKSELRDALELPFTQPDLFKYYGVQPLRGLLLYGSPGCGKTLLARAAASAIASIHGKESVETGYIYVKSPEILSKWVGNTETEIRELFERGRRHFREHGYKGILAFDEADAIMPQRGTRRSSDIADTIVPMFLGEMDGIDEQQTKENPIVILMTNRADILDPAITRPGRISRHIKVERPTEMTAIDILSIHTRNMPFQDDSNKLPVMAVAISDLFSKSRILYRINNEYDFTLGDAVNGAMLASLAESAKMIALHRDLSSGLKTGVTVDDFRESTKRMFREQRGLNHSYDLQDFAENHGLQPTSIQVERCFGSG